MKVFRIRVNSNDYQSFLPVDSGVMETALFDMDCRRKSSEWKPPAVYIFNPKLKRGNFFGICPGAFALDSLAKEKLLDVLEMSGELLPLPHQGEEFHVLNVLECVNSLDDERTKWVLGKTTNARIRIEEYHFVAGRFSESTLFKIPETAGAEVLTVSGIKDPEDEFKSIVEREGLQGILFEELWSDA